MMKRYQVVIVVDIRGLIEETIAEDDELTQELKDKCDHERYLGFECEIRKIHLEDIEKYGEDCVDWDVVY